MDTKHDRRTFLKVAGGGTAVAATVGRVATDAAQSGAFVATAGSSDLCFLNARDLATLIRSKKASAREVMAAPRADQPR